MLIVYMSGSPFILGYPSEVRYDTAAEIECIPVIIDHNLGAVGIRDLLKRGIGSKRLYKGGYIGIVNLKKTLDGL